MLGMIFNSSFSSANRDNMHRSVSLEIEFNRLMGRWFSGRVGLREGLGKVIIIADFQGVGKWAIVRIEFIRFKIVGKYSGGSCFRCLFVMRSGPGAFLGLSLTISVESCSIVIGRIGGDGGGLLRN